jgi:signal transduction histidine kinase
MWRLGLVGLTGAAVGLAAEWVGTGWKEPGQWIPDLAVGWAFIGCGLIAAWKRPASRTGWLMVATGFTWFVGNFSEVGLPAVAWVAAHAVYLHRGPLVHLLLSYPSGRTTSRVTHAAIAVGYVVAIITPLWRSEVTTILLAVLLVVACAYNYARAVGWLRRARRIALQAAAGLSLVLVATAVARLLLPAGDATGPSLLVYEVSFCLIAGGLLAGLLAAPWQGVLVADLVVEVGEARSGTIRGQLSRALGDPSLEIGYWLPNLSMYVDAQGRALTLPEPGSGRSMTVLEDQSQPVAALIHDPAVLDDPGLVQAVTSAAQLAAANARLRAEVQAQIEELSASRRRILEAGDEQRRRLERRLQERATARLRDLVVTLDHCQKAAITQQTKDQIAHSEDQLQHTLDDLQRLANGLHPRVLAEQGLSNALAELARGIQLPIDLEVTTAKLPPRLVVAAYFICAEALSNTAKHAAASRVTAALTSDDDKLKIEITDDGIGGADVSHGSGLLGLADRVETLGGRMHVESLPGHGTRLAAEIPLGGEATEVGDSADLDPRLI